MVAEKTGISKNVISRDNGFLAQMKLIADSSNKKVATDLCRELARAYVNSDTDEVKKIWKNIVSNNAFFDKMVEKVRRGEKIERAEYIRYIISSADINLSNNSRSGAISIIEILKIVNMIEEYDGKISIVQGKEKEARNEENTEYTEKDDTAAMREKGTVKEGAEDVLEDYFIQPYTCKSGKTAKLIIPADASKDDLLLIKDLLLLLMKRKYKIDSTE